MNGDIKKYNIIYADPPWPIALISRKVRPKQLDMPYKRMTYDDILKMPIKQIADEKNCHLFIWTTHKWLPKTFAVMQHWGFKYNCCITWDKEYGFTPFSFMWSTEFLLYGQLIGKWNRPPGVGKFKTYFRGKPGEHSRKPHSAREMIVDFCGDLPRVELFARDRNELFNEYEGWDVFGNEANGSIELPEVA